MSHLTQPNHTAYIAQFAVLNGPQMIARILGFSGISPGARVSITTTSTYQLMAMAMIDGNSYHSAPQDVATGFLAEVVQVQSHCPTATAAISSLG